MGENNLETALDEVWKEKTSKRLIPLRKPTLNNSWQGAATGETAYIDLFSKDIKISSSFINELKENGVNYRNSLDGIIEHEIGHYFVMPHSLTVELLEIAALKDMADPKNEGGIKKRDAIINYFNDIAVNLNIIMRGNDVSNNLGLVYKNMDDEGSKIGKLLRAYYHSFAKNIDFGADLKELDDSLKEKFIALGSLDFNPKDKAAIISNLSAFRRVIEDLVKGEHRACMFDRDRTSIDKASEEEKKKALRELADILDPEDYKYVYGILNDKKGDDYSHDKEYTDGKKADLAIIEYYRSKALQYPIQVLETPLTNEETQKVSLSEWNPSDGARNMNPLRSGGRIIPGVTKKWINDKYYTYGQKMKIPDCIIVIDSSGSMDRISSGNSYAAIAAVSAAIQYMNNGSKVDVVNFSTITKATKYETQDGVLEAILEDQQQSTNFPYREVQKLMYEGNKDLIVITDGLVDYNHLTNFLDMVDENGKNNRNSFIYIRKDDPSNYNYDNFRDRYKHIRFHIVKDERDIPNLVLGDTRYEFK